ncbi:nSTAND1 domain-containing NTPase [Actinosynnema sp. NPDC004786]
MGNAITVYLSSPGDVRDERAAVLEVVRRLRFDPFLDPGTDLRVVSWDNPDAPVPLPLSEQPQDTVDSVQGLPSESDIVIAVLWSRLGTPVRGAASGTVWEIEDALRAGGPDVLVYHKTPPATVALGDPDWHAKAEQYRALTDYLATLRERGVVQEFADLGEFRSLVDAHLRRLIARRTRPAAPRRTRWDASRSPYPGLQAFTTADADCFFGRDHEVDALVGLVRAHRLVTVVGPSGSGKSSLVGAGLLPRLAAAGWRTPRYADGAWSGHRVTPRGIAAGQELPEPEDARTVVFVDQFEEVFAPAAGAHRQALLDRLVDLADSGGATVVASLRADFLGPALEHPGLARHLRSAMLPLGPPDLSSVSEIIRRPAALAGLRFDRDLPELLLVHARQEPGRLPLLAFALHELHLRRDGDRLTTAAYEEIGGVEGAIGHLAERAFRALPDEVRAEFGAVVRKLVEVDEVGGPVRGRAAQAELSAPRRRALVDALVDARLLVTGTGPDPFVEVAHEAIFRGWPRFARWLDAGHEDLLAVNRMRRAAADWARSGRDPLFLWPQERIEPVVGAVTRMDVALTPQERDFLRPEPERLLDELVTPGLPHSRRREISTRLARLGDQRPGVGAVDGRPDIVWCEVPGDEPLWIAKYPVTVEQLAAFRRGRFRTTDARPTGLEGRQPNAPAAVTWHEAVVFCRWLDGLRDRAWPRHGVVRLPTAREWVRAAGGGSTRYPWGDDWRDDHANTAASGLGGPIAVGMYPLGRSPAGGALDLVGTVWEWCEDDPGTAPEGVHVLKGGSAREHPDRCRVDVDRVMRGDVVRDDRGFRPCVGPALWAGGAR